MSLLKKPFKILVIDDDYINNIITEEIIKNTGIASEIYVTMHGQEAIEFIEQHCMSDTAVDCPDLVLLDLNMPVMDGFEFLEKIQDHQIKHQLKIVILTSSTDFRDIEKAGKYDIAGFLSKPLTADKFRNLYTKLTAAYENKA